MLQLDYKKQIEQKVIRDVAAVAIEPRPSGYGRQS